jgi:hypothetical protein
MQGHREVRGDRALADAALAAHHEHDVLHVGYRVLARDVAPDDAHLGRDVDGRRARAGKRARHLADQPLFQGRGRRRENQPERGLARCVDRDVVDHVEVGEGLVEVRMLDLAERFERRFARE